MYKKIFMIIVLVLCFSMVGCADLFQDEDKTVVSEDLGVLIWPETELSHMIPKPEAEKGKIEQLSNEVFAVYIGEVSESYFEQYVTDCIALGFDNNFSYSNNVFSGKNNAGYSLYMRYNNKIMYIKLEMPNVQNDENNSSTDKIFGVLPGSKDFNDISSTLVIDSTSGVTAVYEETSGKGYVFVSTTTGFSQKVTVTVGVDLNGVITGIQVDMDSRDYPVNENTINSYIGKDSTLSGIEITTGATVSSYAVTRAVSNGFNVLAVNGKLASVKKEPEQVFEELLSTITSGFVKGNTLTASGNIYQAYASLNKSVVVTYVNKDETKLLTVTNVNGATKVYQSNLLDENTQTYELVDVTAENADVVIEVNEFATANITSLHNTLVSKITRMYSNVAETDITEVEITTYGSIVAAASFINDGNVWNAYLAYSINAYNNSVVKTYVVIDHEGKIANVDVIGLFGDEEYFDVAHRFNEAGYESGFAGNNDFVDTNVISGATMTTNAIKQAIKDAFAEFANIN